MEGKFLVQNEGGGTNLDAGLDEGRSQWEGKSWKRIQATTF